VDAGFQGVGRDVGARGVELLGQLQLLVEFRREGHEPPLPQRLRACGVLVCIP
jgi:hypothetical protein